MKLHKQIGNRGFTLVELMIVIVIIGVLAALASFGFMQYIKKSKTAEADEMVKKLGDGAKIYYTSEQKYGGDENAWHASGGGSQAPGFPVPYTDKVFPGGGNGATASTGATTPQGGGKVNPSLTESAVGTLKKLQFDVKDPLYFRYLYKSDNTGGSATAAILAEADFDSDGSTAGDASSPSPNNHSVTKTLTVDGGEVVVPPSVTSNEFK